MEESEIPSKINRYMRPFLESLYRYLRHTTYDQQKDRHASQERAERRMHELYQFLQNHKKVLCSFDNTVGIEIKNPKKLHISVEEEQSDRERQTLNNDMVQLKDVNVFKHKNRKPLCKGSANLQSIYDSEFGHARQEVSKITCVTSVSGDLASTGTTVSKHIT